MSDSEPRHRLGRAPPSLHKQNSWSPDIHREEKWRNRLINHRQRRGSSVTDDDLEELRACFELGFDLDSPDLDPKLSSTFPALELYQAVSRRQYSFSRSSSGSFSDSDTASCSVESPRTIVDLGEDPAIVKAKLKQWAQVVACTARCSSPKSCSGRSSSPKLS